MNRHNNYDDTIAAIATASGPGGVAIVRISGPDSARILDALVDTGRTGIAPELTWPTHVLRHGLVRDNTGAAMDEVLAVLMRGPRSFTGEDVAEIHTHGGAVACRSVLELCLRAGARLAEPGEFTRRAFMNGRLDLTRAEAVADMVNARTQAALRAAARQLSGDLFQELSGVREQLMTVFAGLEALLNFPDDDTERGQLLRLRQDMAAAERRIAKLLATARNGQALRDGVRLVLCGRPNVGKSSLLNALLKHDRAIVTDIAGTTRDTLEETADIGGIPVNCIDTAGILAPRDRVEQEAVRRSRKSIETADLVVLVLDHSCPLEDTDRALLEEMKTRSTLVALNKADLPPAFDAAGITALPVRSVSALSRLGMEGLEATLAAMVSGGTLPDQGDLVITNIRHAQALRQAAEALQQSLAVIDTNGPAEVASDGIRTAVGTLDTVTGRDADADVIEAIFTKFCIGK